MDQWNYKCRCCGTTMHQKARGGAQQFTSEGMALVYVKNAVLGRVMDDPGRPGSTHDNFIGRGVTEGSEDHNFDMLNIAYEGGYAGPYKPEHRKPGHRSVCLRVEACKDLELRISMPEGKTGKADAREALDWFLGVFDKLETDQEREALKCYLTGGHDWEHTSTTEH